MKADKNSQAPPLDCDDPNLEPVRNAAERRLAESWTLQRAAVELSAQSAGVMTRDDWLAILEEQVREKALQIVGGEVQADDVNALLDAHPRWRKIGTPRLPSARRADENTAGRWDASMHAAHWTTMAAISPSEAASILCCSDPLDDKADPEAVTNEETGPDDFKLLLRVFLDVDRSNQARVHTIVEWLEIAKVRGCRHHSWLSQYLEVRERLGFPIAQGGKPGHSEAANVTDSERRLAHLRTLGGTSKYRDGVWRFAGIAALVRIEKSEGRSRNDEKTIRADLKEAATAELAAKTAGHFNGLGQR